MTGLTTIESMLKSIKSKDNIKDNETVQTRPIIDTSSVAGKNQNGAPRVNQERYYCNSDFYSSDL
jgi:hypothetical protein